MKHFRPIPMQGQRLEALSVPQTLQQQAQQQAAQTPPPADSSTPPWGSDEDFNPEKAWNLIQNLKSDKAGLQSRLDTVTTEKDGEIATLTQQLTEKTNSLTDAEGKITTLEATVSDTEGKLSKAETLTTKQQLLSDAGLPLKYAPQVVGDDEAAWKASVSSLQELKGTSTPQREVDPAQRAAENGGDQKPSKDEAARAVFGL